MTNPGHWELPSTSAREISRWTVTDVQGRGDGAIYTCDVGLEGRYFGEALDPGAEGGPCDFDLVMRGLQLRDDPPRRLAGRLKEWLGLPVAEQREASLELSCGMGGLFDQSLVLTLGQRDDTISGGRPVATLEYRIGRMQGEFTYVVDARSLGTLADGISRVLG